MITPLHCASGFPGVLGQSLTFLNLSSLVFKEKITKTQPLGKPYLSMFVPYQLFMGSDDTGLYTPICLTICFGEYHSQIENFMILFSFLPPEKSVCRSRSNS